MQFPVLNHAAQVTAADALMLLLIGANLAALLGWGGFLILRQRRRREALVSDRDLLAKVVRSCEAIDQAGPDSRDIAEAGFIQAARLIPISHFLVGIFDQDHLRTLLRIQEGSRIPDLRLPLKDEKLRALSELLDPSQDDKEIPRNGQDTRWVRALFEGMAPSTDSILISPMRVDGNTFGFILIGRSSLGSDNGRHELILELLSAQLAHSLERHSLNQEVLSRTRVVNLINEISRRLISLGPLEETFGDIATLIMDAFRGDRVRLLEMSENGTVVRAAAPAADVIPRELEPAQSETISWVIEEGRTLQYVRLSMEGDEGEGGTTSGLAAPLRVEGKMLGVMEIEARHGIPFSDQHVELAEMIAAQLAIAILEARHFTRQQQESYIRTVLLEVARHAAQPGDPTLALQSVLQLTTLIGGTKWAMLLQPGADTGTLRPTAMAGLRPTHKAEAGALRFDPGDFGIQPPIRESDRPITMPVPDGLVKMIGAREAYVFRLSDGEQLLGLLLTDASAGTEEAEALIAGIAHQISLRLENARLMHEMSLRQALETEIAMARDIQAGFLPRKLPVHAGWEIGIDWEAARDVGGDFYDFIRLDPGSKGSRWGISVADVSGKSVSAALFMAVCRTLLRSIGPSHIDPGMVLRRMNTVLQSESLSDFFISIFYAVWEPEGGSISYANAGHNPPILIQANADARWLSEHGMVLGVKEEASYWTYRHDFSPGDLLVLYTDGVTEATSPHGDFFGTDQLMALCQSLRDCEAQTIATEIGAHVREFSETPALSDDLTILTLKRTGEPDGSNAPAPRPGGSQ
jgi:serine phosphatase RsbU (regulator of sigma subunit)